jgi:two-component sensor histidine kinase
METIYKNDPELLRALKEKTDARAFQFTYYLAISAIFLWSLWLIADYQLLNESFFEFAIIRFSLSAGALITTFLMIKKKINHITAQFLLYIPALTFLGFLFNAVPEDQLFFYCISGNFMVIVSGFIFFIMPASRAIFFGVYAILIVFVFQSILSIHSINTLMINGGVLYISMIFFIVAYTIIRYKSIQNSLKNEIIVNYTNKLLKEQQAFLESTNTELKQTIADKEILLKEIHHRVKNNLQIISSLLSLQNDDNNSIEEVLEKSKNRIHAMSILHETLYKSERLNSIDLNVYISKLIIELKKAFVNNNKTTISIQHSEDKMILDMDKVIPIGLILNELITNSFKHAFTIDDTGEIIITISSVNKKNELKICDNGKGFSKNINPDNPSTLGLRLVHGLVNQINGTIMFSSNNNGSIVIISF